MKLILRNLIKPFSLIVCIGMALLAGLSCSDDPIEQTPPMQTGPSTILYDEFEGLQLVIYQNPQYDLTVAYNRVLDGRVLDFKESDSLPAVLEDNLGNYWDVFGEAVSGPNKGKKLLFPNQVKAYWFSVASLYPEVSLYSEGVEKPRLDNIEKDGWLIDTDYVVQAALPNAIPAIYNPDFKRVTTKDLFIDGNHKQDDLILAVRLNGVERIYPERILEYHEIVNDVFGNTNVVVSFCPLTGTGFCWDRDNRNYFVSGFLHNANLIMTDWESNSQWSQIYGQSIFGTEQGASLEPLQIIEMNWEGRALLTTDQMLDTGQLLPANSPYQSYKASPSVGYPISFEDSRVSAKEKVLAIINNNKAKVYRTTDFQ